MLLSTMVLVTIAAIRWHSARGHAQQAAAARQAAQHLRAAYRTAAVTPMNTMRAQGRQLPAPVRDRYAHTLEDALPTQADHLLCEPGWDALAATLAQAEQAGHDPETLLNQAVESRELDTADNVTDVLVWRLRRIGELPAAAIPAHARTNPRLPPQQPQAPKPTTTESAARRNTSSSHRPGPRR